MDATSTSYQFGQYTEDMKDWKTPVSENPVTPYWNYDSREPQLTKTDKNYPTFSLQFCPVSPICVSRFMKYPTDAEPLTIQMLDTGLTYPITVRLEQREGTTPKHNQAVGCYTVGLTVTAAYNGVMNVEEEFAWCKLQDVGDEPMLTTAPLADTACSVAGTYNGTPHFTWNVTHRPEVIKVVYSQKQEWKAAYDPVTDTQSIKCYEYEPPQLLVNAIYKCNTHWDDFNDRTARACKLKVFKPDAATYIEWTFTNALATKFDETGVRNRGHYEAQIAITAEAVTVAANECDNANFSTWYKAGVA